MKARKGNWRRFIPWPKRLLGQMIVLILVALLLAQGISLWVLSGAHQQAITGHSQKFMMRQLTSIVRLLDTTPADLHARILANWSRPGVRVSMVTHTKVTLPHTQLERRLTRRLERSLGENYRDRIRVTLKVADHSRKRHGHTGGKPNEYGEWRKNLPHLPRRGMVLLEELQVAIQLTDGRWLESRAAAPTVSPLAAGQTLISLLVASVLVLAVLIWQLRKITRPLAKLAKAANGLGRGQAVPPLEERGPADVKETIGAFNRMNERVTRFVSDRTHMLAALSHDLRTPMTSMRLRLEMQEPSDSRDKLLLSLDEMQQMSDATLAFIRDSGATEATQKVDLAAVISSICDDLADTGADVVFDYRQQKIIACRPLSLKRALRNLIENAIKYGDTAEVTLSNEVHGLIIAVQDKGPGIPETQLSEVFEPFVRLETSRNRDTGGIGLGLSIAQQIINSHGGELRLSNRELGLRVEVIFPH